MIAGCLDVHHILCPEQRLHQGNDDEDLDMGRHFQEYVQYVAPQLLQVQFQVVT